MLVEYCEYKNNWRDGIQKLYAPGSSHTLIAESTWHEDSRLEEKKFSTDGTLLSWMKRSEDGTVLLTKEYNPKGLILKDFELGHYPILLRREYDNQTGSVLYEAWEASAEIFIQRKFLPSGLILDERVQQKSSRQVVAEISISRNEKGHILSFDLKHDFLLKYLLKPIPTGRWILHKPGPEYHLMEGVKDLGVISEPKTDQPLMTGWKRTRSQEVYFDNGIETANSRFYYPDSDNIESELKKDGDFLTYELFDTSNEKILELKRKVTENIWTGIHKHSNGLTQVIEEIRATSLSTDISVRPSYFENHGKMSICDVEGALLSERYFQNGLLDGLSSTYTEQDQLKVRIEDFYLGGQLINRKIINGLKIIFEKNFSTGMKEGIKKPELQYLFPELLEDSSGYILYFSFEDFLISAQWVKPKATSSEKDDILFNMHNKSPILRLNKSGGTFGNNHYYLDKKMAIYSSSSKDGPYKDQKSCEYIDWIKEHIESLIDYKRWLLNDRKF